MTFSAGDAVQVQWGVKWFPGKVLRVVSAASWEISYDGYDASWNEVVGPERLLPAGAAIPAPAPPPPAPPVVLDGPLDGAAAIAWGELQHTYGPATDVPECLSALRSTDRTWRQKAIGHLGNALDHQGIGRCEATLAAAPFLVRLFADASVPDRAEIANLLADFAVGDTFWFQHFGFHPVEQTNPDHYARPKAWSHSSGGAIRSRGYPDPGRTMDMRPGHGLIDIYEQIERGTPVYLAALSDGDPAVRASAAQVLAFLSRRGGESAPVLGRVLASDPDPAVRASCMLGLSHASFFIADEKARARDLLIAAWQRGVATPLERRALALALARYEGDVMPLVRPALMDDLAAGVPALAPPRPFPWRRVDSARLLFFTAFYGSPVADRPPVALAASTGLARIADEAEASDVGDQLAFCCFGPPRDGFVANIGETEDDVRQLLRALASAPIAWTYGDVARRFQAHNLPATYDAFRAWVHGATGG